MDDTFSFFGRSVPNLAKLFGSTLVILGILSFAITGFDSAAKTALIPAAMGAPMFLLGLLSERNEKNRHHYMHACMVLALFMVVSPISMFVMMGVPDSNLTLVSLILLLIIGSTFMVAGIKSFRHARILRESSGV
tara:strand:+ start:35266 stop:35670 length:405 start_codon:yes stop_codon:yes gene_type:complete